MTGKADVWTEVEAFREKYLNGSSDLPVDVFEIAELKLKLDPIPFDDLFAKYQADAAITLDFTGIYVDAEAYELLEKAPIWKQQRLRFSVAHELGHYVLHKEIASKLSFKNFDEFNGWTRTYGGRKYSLEQAANEFGGRLLVPIDRLTKFFDEFAAKFDKEFPHWRANEGMRNLFTQTIAPRFGVNSDVISVRLDRENLWPAS